MLNEYKNIHLILPLVGGMAIAPCYAEEQRITHKTTVVRDLPTSLKGKTVSVVFEKSPKMQQLVTDYLKSRGLSVVAESPADVAIRIFGAFRIGRHEEKGLSGMIGEIAEPSIAYSTSADSSDPATAAGRQFVLSAILANSISLTDLFTWLSEKSGIAGWINKSITGDPRGWCLSGNCDQISTRILLNLNGSAMGKSFMWRVETNSHGKHIVFDRALAESIERLLSPLQLDDIEPASDQPAERGD